MKKRIETFLCDYGMNKRTVGYSQDIMVMVQRMDLDI